MKERKKKKKTKTQSDYDNDDEEVKWGIEKKHTHFHWCVLDKAHIFARIVEQTMCIGVEAYTSPKCVCFFFFSSFLSESKRQRQRQGQRQRKENVCCWFYFPFHFRLDFHFRFENVKWKRFDDALLSRLYPIHNKPKVNW